MCKKWQTARKITIKDSLIKEIKAELEVFRKNYPEGKSKEKENPFNKEYKTKLLERTYKVYASQDSFMNWIAGISSGALFFCIGQILGKQSPTGIVLYDLLYLIMACFVTFLLAVLFKLLAEIRFDPLLVELEILGALWHSHNLKAEIEKDLTAGDSPDISNQIKFLKNHLHQLRLSNPEYVKRLKLKTNTKAILINSIYRATIFFFVFAVIRSLLLFLNMRIF